MSPKFNISNYKLRAKYRGQSILQTHFKSDAPRSKQEIIKAIKAVQKLAKDNNKNYDFIVSLKYNGNRWRNDKIFTYDQNPKIWVPEDYEMSGYNANSNKHVKQQNEFNEFIIYSVPKGKPQGGASDYNDCLYHALCLGLNGVSNFPASIQKPMTFKTKLGLSRKDKVDVSLLPKVEDLIKVNIFCTGDYTYTSGKKFNYSVHLTLKNGHYELNKSVKKKYDVPTNTKKIGFIAFSTDNQYDVITEDFEIKVSKSEKQFLNEKYPDYFFIDKTKYLFKKSLKELFFEFKQGRNDIFEETEGFIDLNKTPYFSQTAKKVIHYKSSFVDEPEELTPNEAIWIKKAFMGGLLFAKEGNYKNAVCIDMNSMYSYFMSHEHFFIPVKQGEFKIFDDYYIKKIVPFGIYRCVITTDKKEQSLFKFNVDNYYTHYDITNAMQLGFDVKLIQDGQANALLYDSQSRIQGSRAFGEAIKYLYELKQKVKYTKNIMSATWGFMMEKTTKKFVVSDETDIEIPDTYTIETISKYNDCMKIKAMKDEQVYKSNWARIGAFLTAYCRYSLRKVVSDNNINIENIIRIHTDSITMINEPIRNELLGYELGQFKIEKQGNCEVHNVNEVIWD
jgi:hypothetical protein